MESMSRAPRLVQRDYTELSERELIDSMMHDGLVCPFSKKSMGQIADELAARAGISRGDQDQYALESHRRAVAATETGAFKAEIVSVSEVSRDEGPRSNTSIDQLAKLQPVFQASGSVTAGNSAMISDGAAAVVVGSESVATRLGVRPFARIVATATSGGEPRDVFTAPVDAIRRVLAKANLDIQNIDLFEINEAFAVQMLACMQALRLPHERVNVHGGAIALGHPIGASGARVLVTLLHAMERRDARFGIAALCLGGGNAVAMLVERERK
jgi:acetyl-CoA C-acetyltransferase